MSQETHKEESHKTEITVPELKTPLAVTLIPETGVVLPEEEKIPLSKYTHALLNAIKAIKPKPKPDDISKITVSQTVSFLAIVYEKIRNAVEYREEHLIRRAAIERILRRRFALNPSVKGEAENILRELLWARYFPNGSLGEEDIDTIQKIIDRYLLVKKLTMAGRDGNTRKMIDEFLMDMLTCEVEETLAPTETLRDSSYMYFVYQILRDKVKISHIKDEQKDAYLLTAIDKTYRKSDRPYQRYHLFITFYQPLQKYSDKEIQAFSTKIPDIFKKIDEMRHHSYVENLAKFVKRQLPPFLILFEIINKKGKEVEEIISVKERLWQEVDVMCREKYQQVKSKLRGVAIKSLIYIFLTKMLMAIILEYPVSKALFNDVNTKAIIINSVFPPILMLIIIFFFKLPGEDNTKKIFQRIIEVVDEDKSFETKVAYISNRLKVKKPVQVFGFTIFYSFTFLVTLYLIYLVLDLLEFNIISKGIFIFFVSVVSFFSYRIKRIVNEYKLDEKEGILTPVVDFFFMPILSLGKFFSSEVARLNFASVIFDFIIEAPFKLLIQIVEDWISFVRARKEEIA
jgi:hypothetical protein